MRAVTNGEFESNAWRSSARAGAPTAVWWLLAALLCASCGKAPAVHYYTLHLPSPPGGDPKTSFVIAVQQFRATEVLRDDRILYYQSPTQLDFYQQHRWSADPATMLSELTARQLQQTGVFAQIRLAPFREPVDYVLNGRVWNFEEVDYQGGVKVRVGLALILLRSRDRQIVWSTQRQTENGVQEPGVAGVANALSTATNRVLEEMIPGIVAQVESDFKASKDGTTK